jgi:hypothetical protein
MRRPLFVMALLSLLLFAVAGLTACGSRSAQASSQNTPSVQHTQGDQMNYNYLVAKLRASGAKVMPGTAISQPFMDVQGRTLAVNGEQLQVYEYASLVDANKQAARISPDGTAFTTVSSSGMQVGATQVDWVKPPHLYKAGRIIVIYIGTNNAVMHLLEGILGKQFAGV